MEYVKNVCELHTTHHEVRVVCSDCSKFVCFFCKPTDKPHKATDIETPVNFTISKLDTDVRTVKKQLDITKLDLGQFEKSVKEAKSKVNIKTKALIKHGQDVLDMIDTVAHEHRMEQEASIIDLTKKLVELNQLKQLVQDNAFTQSHIERVQHFQRKTSPGEPLSCSTLLKNAFSYSKRIAIVDEFQSKCHDTVKKYFGTPVLAEISRMWPTVLVLQFQCPDTPSRRVKAVRSNCGKLNVLYSDGTQSGLETVISVYDIQTKACLKTDILKTNPKQRKIKIAVNNSTSLLLVPSIWSGEYRNLDVSRKIHSLQKSKHSGMFNVCEKNALLEKAWQKVFKIRVEDPVAICADSSERYFAVIQCHAASASSEPRTYSVALFRRGQPDGYATFQPAKSRRTSRPAPSAMENGNAQASFPSANQSVSQRLQCTSFDGKIHAHGQTACQANDPVCATKPEDFLPSDICFHVVDGKEVLLVSDEARDTIHCVDFDTANVLENGQVACVSEIGSGCPMLRGPTCLDVDDTGVLWVGCKDGTLLKCVPTTSLRLPQDHSQLDEDEEVGL